MSVMPDIAVNLAFGAVALGAMLLALFLFGCVMTVLTDDGGRPAAPLWVRVVGFTTILVPAAVALGAAVRAAL